VSTVLKAEESAHPARSSVLESITEAFVALDREGRSTSVNGEAERLMGVPREQVLGKVIRDVFPARCERLSKCAAGRRFPNSAR
jgi:PAS domain S-box-containing protein